MEEQFSSSAPCSRALSIFSIFHFFFHFLASRYFFHFLLVRARPGSGYTKEAVAAEMQPDSLDVQPDVYFSITKYSFCQRAVQEIRNNVWRISVCGG